MIRKGTLLDIPIIAEILVNTWQTCYQSFLPKSFLDNLKIEKQIKRHQKIMGRGIDYFVYENSQGVIQGFTSYGKNRAKNIPAPMELYTLYVSPKGQQKGIGQQLLNQVLMALKPIGGALCVEVMAENPYISFYEKNDFQFFQKESMNVEELTIENLLLIKK